MPGQSLHVHAWCRLRVEQQQPAGRASTELGMHLTCAGPVNPTAPVTPLLKTLWLWPVAAAGLLLLRRWNCVMLANALFSADLVSKEAAESALETYAEVGWPQLSLWPQAYVSGGRVDGHFFQCRQCAGRVCSFLPVSWASTRFQPGKVTHHASFLLVLPCKWDPLCCTGAAAYVACLLHTGADGHLQQPDGEEAWPQQP